MPNLQKKLVSNTFYLFLNWFFVTLLSLLYWVIIGNTLSRDQYGIVATSVNLMLFVSGFSHLGLNSTVSKLIPEYIQKKNYKKSSALIKFSLTIILISNGLFALFISLNASALAYLLKVPTIAIYMCSIGLFALSLTNYLASIIYGFQNMKKNFIVTLLGHIVKVVSSGLLIFLGFSYFGPILGFIICFLLMSILFFERRWFKSNSVKINKKQVIFHYTLPAFIMSISALVFTNMQLIILPFFTTQAITGLFALAMTLTSPIGVIPTVLSNALFPITSQLAVNGEAKKQSHLLNSTIRYTLFFVLPITIFLIYYPELLIILFRFKPEYLEAAYLFPILGVAAFFLGLSGIFLSSLYAIRKTKLNRNIWAFSALILLILEIILTPMFSALGLSIAFLLSNLLLAALGYFYLKKYLKIDLNFRSVAKLILANIIFFGLLFIANIFIKSNLIKFFVAIASGISYLLVLVPMRFYKKEDIEIINILYERSPVLKDQIRSVSNFLSKHVQD
jgi:stage V sporulation protein B